MGTTGLPGTVLRLPTVYGPGGYQHRLFEYLKRMDDGRPAILLGEGMASWRWTHGYVEDVALAVVLAVADEQAAGGVYPVLGGCARSGTPSGGTVRSWPSPTTACPSTSTGASPRASTGSRPRAASGGSSVSRRRSLVKKHSGGP